MDKQIGEYMEKYLSIYLCGYRKGYSCQHALLVMIEKWKQILDKGGYAGGILMDLSKAFDTINHRLLIAKLHAYGFDVSALEIVNDYLSDRWQRTKINTSFSTWSLIVCGVPQGSVLGPKFFNIFLNDLFYLFENTLVCNLADDTTPYACDMDLSNLIRNLEEDTASAILWFDANHMMLNEEKCHFLISSIKTSVEHLYIKVGDQIIWESPKEKLLGLDIDKQLKFNNHLLEICKKTSCKVTALNRLAKIVPLQKKRTIMNAFIESQFSHCPLLWMYCSREVNNRINRVHKRALRLVYLDYTSSFEELLRIDGSVNIHQRNIQLVAIEMFKVFREIGPEIVRNLFVVNRSRPNRAFHKPNVNNEMTGKDSICYFGPRVWNEMLPDELKSIEELKEFKDKVKKWIPTKDVCRCKLCLMYVAGVGYVHTSE
jgi:hypothetical protein